MNTEYFVEAWRGLECIGFSTVARPDTVRRRADHFIVDLNADRVYVRAGLRGEDLASWQATGGWRFPDRMWGSRLSEELSK
jgi:hypothetical protein